MKLGGLVLYTQYFEDYLSFLTEVLELELTELRDQSMKLSLTSGYLEIKKADDKVSESLNSMVVFELEEEDFQDLVSKLSFFYYRRGPSRFRIIKNDPSFCELIDPDGRAWRFEMPSFLEYSSSYQAQV